MHMVTFLKKTLIMLSKNKRFQWFYNWAILILCLLAAGVLIAGYVKPEYEKEFQVIDTGIIVIFALDYFVRFWTADGKRAFFKTNIIDLIAIIPFSSIFQTLRIARLLRFTKVLKAFTIFAFFLKLQKSIERFIKTNNFHYILMLTIVTIFAGALGMHFAENKTFADSLWWSFVTATTVGYGDISPSTPAGRLIAVILMISGIGFISMLTGTISTFFIEKHRQRVTFKEETLENIKEKLDDFDNLSPEDVDNIFLVLKSLKKDCEIM